MGALILLLGPGGRAAGWSRRLDDLGDERRDPPTATKVSRKRDVVVVADE